ncbi:hypothetical protein SODALDRAFT_112343 [Sodiomyces alkalinus F11]|uniref:Uncharacterized protein n=1 Tax=Sodiomyces alkalinus (strain CBS 110278 / VKM F-3762 / F11) TaxID=1314773 RepID=A0A3N2Q2X5_SODAK|nr:hypothetical protein SODALDRAFT_112343 [Sodiomyces alkalinus F11]ROT41119.1 hypothetical protein SODALDRAFT_112343 [Sodiomyces alkalinus F11]
MCGGENIYYTACGCWTGHVILYTCPRGQALGGSHCYGLEVAGVHRVEGYCITCKRRAEQMKRVGVEYSLAAGDRDEANARHGRAYVKELIRQEKEKAGETPWRPESSQEENKKRRWRVYYMDAGRGGDDGEAETKKVAEAERGSGGPRAPPSGLDMDDPLVLWKLHYSRISDPEEKARGAKSVSFAGSSGSQTSKISSSEGSSEDTEDEAWVVRPLRSSRPDQQQSRPREGSDEFWN